MANEHGPIACPPMRESLPMWLSRTSLCTLKIATTVANSNEQSKFYSRLEEGAIDTERTVQYLSRLAADVVHVDIAPTVPPHYEQRDTQ